MDKQEKLLFMGVDSSTRYALDYAKQIGVTTIVTDYNSPEKSPIKLMADECWMIDVKNLDMLELSCKRAEITGVYAGNNEFCLDKAKELAKRLRLPFYASEDGWRCSRDKGIFKECCIAVGLNVPKRYAPKKKIKPEDLTEIEYPVIVKPVDAGSQRGLSLCKNEKELYTGFNRALRFSEKKSIIVEDYIDGDEVDIFLFVVDGNPIVTAINDKYFMQVNKRKNACFQPYPSRFYEEYFNKDEKKVKQLFQRMKIRQGAAFLQAVYRDGIFYYLELGYRIDGVGSWVSAKQLNHFSNVEKMVDLALGKKITMEELKGADFSINDKVSATYLFWAKPGKIQKIVGLAETKAMEGVEIVFERFHIGDVIWETDNMTQMAFYINIVALSQAALLQKLREINATLHFYNENGDELLIPFGNYKSIVWK